MSEPRCDNTSADVLARARELYGAAREAEDRWGTIGAAHSVIAAAITDVERHKDEVCRASIDLQLRMREDVEQRLASALADGEREKVDHMLAYSARVKERDEAESHIRALEEKLALMTTAKLLADGVSRGLQERLQTIERETREACVREYREQEMARCKATKSRPDGEARQGDGR